MVPFMKYLNLAKQCGMLYIHVHGFLKQVYRLQHKCTDLTKLYFIKEASLGMKSQGSPCTYMYVLGDLQTRGCKRLPDEALPRSVAPKVSLSACLVSEQKEKDLG